MGGLAEIALGAGRADAATGRAVVDIITFIESDWGLHFTLFPVQRVILKAYYGLALDDNPHGFDLSLPIPLDHPAYSEDIVDADGFYKFRIPITDWRRQNAVNLTEAGYLRKLYDEGRCNIREVVPGVERREMVLSIGRRSGKCVTGDTLVLTDQGVFPIRELGDPHGPEVQPLDVGVVQEGARKSRSAYFYNGGVKPTFRIESHTGIAVEGTANHRVRVLHPDGDVRWARMDEIVPGAVLAVNRATETWAQALVDVRAHHVASVRVHQATEQPDEFDARWGLLMGYLVGDGSWADRASLCVTVEHPETREELEGLFRELGGRPSFTLDKRSARTGACRVHDKALREFMHNLGFDWDCKSDTKHTPWVVLRSPREVVRAYLQGLFETDGTVTKSGLSVSFCSASKRLARETQVLLLNFGVLTRLRVKHNNKYDRDYYEITILGLRSRKRFSEEIGFRSRKKQDRLDAGLVNPKKEGGDTESIPHQRAWVSRMLASIPKSNPRGGLGWRRSTMRAVVGNMCKPGSTEDLSYARIRALLPIARELDVDPEVIHHFKSILEMDYFYDEVVEVVPGEAHVFDLNVPEGESFVANGLTNHNTTVSACISAYETYRLLSKGDPQAYYGLPKTNTIQLISVATDKDQAGLLYQEVSGHYRACGFFTQYTANNTMSYARFQTPKDIEQTGSYQSDPGAKATIKVTFRSCIAKGLRGAGNIVIILDEVAHFTDEGQSSADAVYTAVVPSSAAYSPKSPKNKQRPIGPVESKVILISSPLGRQGLFYLNYQKGFKGGVVGDEYLCVQAPTWEVNPTVQAGFLESEYLKDVRGFFTEYGAEFSDRTRGWIEKREDLIACVQPGVKPVTRAAPRQPHFAGIDLAQVGDASALAIGHLDGDRIVVDVVDAIQAGVGEYEGYDRLEFADIVDWVHDYSKRFYISEGIFDQWAGIPFEQALNAKGLKQFQSLRHTPQLTSQMYQNFKDMMFDRKLGLYNWPIAPGDTDCEYITQLLELQAEFKSKYVTLVHAPKVAGKHDDLADALVRMVWITSQHLGKGVTFGGGASFGRALPGAHLVDPRTVMMARRKALMTGSHEDRQALPTTGQSPMGGMFGRRGGSMFGGGRGGRGGRGGGLGGKSRNPWGRT